MKQYKTIENHITYDIKEYDNGDKFWYKNEKLHRENGPARDYADGDKFWYKNGKCHRDGGPAHEYNGNKDYWYNGQYLENITTDEIGRAHV